MNAAIDGMGVAYVPLDFAMPHIEGGQLEEVLADWSPMIPGYHMYYPNRRHTPPAFGLLVNHLRV